MLRTMTTCPFLSDCTARFDAANQRFEDLVARMTPEEAQQRPAPGRWSAAECIEHLNVTAKTYSPKIEGAIQRGQAKQLRAPAPYTQRSLLGRILFWSLAPGKNRKVKAPGIFQPEKTSSPNGGHSDLDYDRVCRDFRDSMERFRQLAIEADGLDLGRIRMATPIGPWPRLTLGEAFEVHSQHIPRHLDQAERALT